MSTIEERFAAMIGVGIKLATRPCDVCDGTGRWMGAIDFPCESCRGEKMIVPGPYDPDVAYFMLLSSVSAMTRARNSENYDTLYRVLDLIHSYSLAVFNHGLASCSPEDVEKLRTRLGFDQPAAASSALSEEELEELLRDDRVEGE